ncbi:60S acidic ribosomal protein P0 [Cricetulus griseus]|nr:60S acidic ribosomal protein P0 [Cricetulus griseus]
MQAQSTGFRTSFFQALGGTIKTSRSTSEILSDVLLIKTGDKAGAREATLLNVACISPLLLWVDHPASLTMVAVTTQNCLHITEWTAVLLSRGCLKCCQCLRIRYLTVTSVLHSVINGYKPALALSVETEYTFPLAEKEDAVQTYLANHPSCSDVYDAPHSAEDDGRSQVFCWYSCPKILIISQKELKLG